MSEAEAKDSQSAAAPAASAPLLHYYRDYLLATYGTVLYRLPLDPGFTCPNRSEDNRGGCTFCPGDGARAVQLADATSISEQLQRGRDFASRRYRATAFMAYFQAYTATFSDLEHLRRLVTPLLAADDVLAISFGARPDCLSPAIIRYLAELNQQKDIWVELGVQTSHNPTLAAINRGHTWQDSRKALFRLAKAGIKTAVHLILGLPGEGLEEFRQTITQLAELPVTALKLHNLHVIRGTALAEEYAHHPFPLANEHEYTEVLLQLLPLIPASWPIIRLTTDTPEEALLAPRWSMNKAQFIDYLLRQMAARGVRQGMAVESASEVSGHSGQAEQGPEPVRTEDGSITCWSSHYQEHYHTLAGARSEARRKYCQPAGLAQRLQAGPVRLLDICFGMGYNSLSALDQAIAQNGIVEVQALELDQAPVRTAARHLQEAGTSFDWNGCLETLVERGSWREKGCRIRLLWGDARHTIRQQIGLFDLIFLDAFSTQRNSELWTVDFFRLIAPLLAEDGLLFTYCAAIPVRSGLLAAGFAVGETLPFGRERGGTAAAHRPELLPAPLPARDLHLIAGPRGIPYRDPHLTWSNREILRHREKEIVQAKQR